MTVAADPIRRRGTPKLPREQRERQLLDAATVEFGTVGFRATSLNTIADRVGVSKALLLTYHGSKEDLYVACVERAGSNLAGRIEAVIATEQTAGSMAMETLRAIFDALEERPHEWNLLHDRSLPTGSSPEVASKRYRVLIADQARRGVRGFRHLQDTLDEDDLNILTDIWMSTVGAVVGWWLHHPDRSPAEMAERCRRILGSLANA